MYAELKAESREAVRERAYQRRSPGSRPAITGNQRRSPGIGGRVPGIDRDAAGSGTKSRKSRAAYGELIGKSAQPRQSPGDLPELPGIGLAVRGRGRELPGMGFEISGAG